MGDRQTAAHKARSGIVWPPRSFRAQSAGPAFGFLKFFPASQSSEGAVRYDGASLGRTEIPGGEFNKHLGPGVVSGHLPR